MCTRNISEVLFQRNLLFSKFKISILHPAPQNCWQQHSKKLYDHLKVGAIVQFTQKVGPMRAKIPSPLLCKRISSPENDNSKFLQKSNDQMRRGPKHRSILYLRSGCSVSKSRNNSYLFSRMAPYMIMDWPCVKTNKFFLLFLVTHCTQVW